MRDSSTMITGLASRSQASSSDSAKPGNLATSSIPLSAAFFF